MRHILNKIILLICLFLFCSHAKAVTPVLEMYLDKDTVHLDETFTLTITLKGGSALSTPDLPDLTYFEIVGRSSQNAIEIINNQMASSKTFEYVLSPKKEGDFSLGPVKAHIEGVAYLAGPIPIKVLPPSSPMPPQAPTYVPLTPYTNPTTPVPSYPSPDKMPQTGPSGPANASQDVFITTELDRQEAYVGEQVLFTFRLYTSIPLNNAQLNLPEFKEFITEELITERKYEVDHQGRRYLVNEWRMALFPTNSGELSIAPTTLKGTVSRPSTQLPFSRDPFFQGFSQRMENKTFSSSALKLHVLPLPPAPDHFTGLVGDFTISSSISKDTLELGETAKWEITLSGKGNIQEATLPKDLQLDSFKVYADKPILKLDKNLNGVTGKKTFQLALVAERPGVAKVPALNLSYFDPVAKEYKPLTTPEFNLQIKGETGQEKLVTAGIQDTQQKALGPTPSDTFDLRPLKDPGLLLYSAKMSVVNTVFFSLLILVPPGLLIFLAIRRRLKQRSLVHKEDRKRSRAFKTARNHLTQLKEGVDLPVEIMGIVKAYLSDRFTIKGEALTPLEVESLLKNHQVPMQTTRRMVYLLEQLDAWKYGQSQLGTQEKELKEEMLSLLREVEKAL